MDTETKYSKLALCQQKCCTEKEKSSQWISHRGKMITYRKQRWGVITLLFWDSEVKQQKLAKRLTSWGVACDLPTAPFWALQVEEKQVSFGNVESQGTKSQSCAGPWNPGQTHIAQRASVLSAPKSHWSANAKKCHLWACPDRRLAKSCHCMRQLRKSWIVIGKIRKHPRKISVM